MASAPGARTSKGWRARLEHVPGRSENASFAIQPGKGADPADLPKMFLASSVPPGFWNRLFTCVGAGHLGKGKPLRAARKKTRSRAEGEPYEVASSLIVET